MQATMDVQESPKKSKQHQMLKDKQVKDLMVDKRRLVEVPYTATLADTINTLMANKVVAVPVAAPPGHWIGAGGSMILESDKQTGVVRKHYIGMVTMLDVLAHIAANGSADDADLAKKMMVPVSSIIGHCIESLSLWTLNPNTSIVDCMEVFSKGIHRAMVPIDGQSENVAGVELTESASCYRMLTQMDLLRFLNDFQELKVIMSHKVSDKQLQAVTASVFGVTNKAKVIDVIKCMRAGSLNAVPIVESSDDIVEDHTQLVNGKQRKIIGTFSATDLRGCPVWQLQPLLNQGVVDFLKMLSAAQFYESTGLRSSSRELVTCQPESSLREAVEKAVSNHVHRVWVVDEQGLLEGVASLTDMIRVIRLWYLTEILQ
ncbi:SNF1-related protein kinase regulatory subunit gamma-like PV42a [Nicotiana tabacum]|uniref:SNF1-related protein kinase regulatory subunit gamma-like PV42a n=2 Tax=Nicotiana TaxID=4085 RepID=A0A1S4DRE1_TOBAC|nr:PREDICTED: SNF1-related protein kinase regulatory subunit gamma-like PV42a [Nicotiana sylvestris]XP_016515982.1 PREDICTED: SNF1-related protein kinase regulatory subunit gamma-like PV42a [Nicotiana tabacum]